MKRVITLILTVSLIMGASTAAFAQPKHKDSKADSKGITSVGYQTSTEQAKKAITQIVTAKAKPVNTKANEKKDSALDKSKKELIKKCDETLEQINKLKSYIISKEGNFLVEFKDKETADAAVESIDAAIKKVENFKKRIEAAASSKELKDLSKELQDNWMKQQTFVKKITGLTSAARLKTAYEETKAMVDKVGAGINAIKSNSRMAVNVESLKKQYEKIVANLEDARTDYLDAVKMFSSINDSSKADKDFKEAQKKLNEAKNGLHDALSNVKKLLTKIKSK